MHSVIIVKSASIVDQFLVFVLQIFAVLGKLYQEIVFQDKCPPLFKRLTNVGQIACETQK